MRLSKEHGLNPTISACIICGKDKNEIILLGAAYKGKAPMKMVTNLEPCDECKEKYLKNGIMLAEATDFDRKPTGSISVITEEAFMRIFHAPIPPKRIVLVEEGMFRELGIVQEVVN